MFQVIIDYLEHPFSIYQKFKPEDALSYLAPQSLFEVSLFRDN